jgi:hypothetical protein
MPADAANMLALRLNLNSMQDVRRGRRRSYTWHAVIRDHRDMSRVLRVPPDERFDPGAMTDSPIGTSERRLTKDMADQECQAFNRTMLSLPPEPTFWWCFVVRPLTIANPL